jgi:hypothetical protein
MDAAVKFRQLYGVVMDWHEYSYALDAMHSEGLASHVGFKNGGMTQYIVGGSND